MNRAQRFLLTLVPLVCLPVYLTVLHAEPGQLARVHGAEPSLSEGLGRCATCHAPAGLDAGCLACHEEIAGQLARNEGYHSFLTQQAADPSCGSCHSEHRGADFRPLNANSWPGGKQAFRHPHLTDFVLDAGKHREVMDRCERCHARERVDALPVAGHAAIRCQETFLGLDSDCRRCHQTPHREGFSSDCLACHDQVDWKQTPAFDHAQVFALDGAHASLTCTQCHTARLDDPVGPTQGTRCADCHQDPHRERPAQLAFTAADSDCARCHSTTSFAEVDQVYAATEHAPERFPLLGKHLAASCRGCHARPGDDAPEGLSLPASLAEVPREACARCHTDVHVDPGSGAVQLEQSADCQACHDEQAFKPTLYQREEHARTGFALEGAHLEVDCVRCHSGFEPPREAGEPIRGCVACHADDDRHIAPFGQRCDDCHGSSPTTWNEATLTPAQHATTGFELAVPHATVECAQCHDPQLPFGQRYREVAPEDCRACHGDPHLAQFDVGSRPAACQTCHVAERWLPSTFDVARHAEAGYPLLGGHAGASCVACHRRFKRPLPSGEVIYRRFRGQSTACKDCHEDPHQGQFADRLAGDGDCAQCHRDETRWAVPAFDHGQTSFALGAAHAAVACDACHQPDPGLAGDAVRYRPLASACAACHTDPHAGQFLLGREDPEAERCERCHTQAAPDWTLPGFDHTATRFPLDGAHADVACAGCHRPFRLRDGRTVVRFRPLGTACKDCHGSFTAHDPR